MKKTLSILAAVIALSSLTGCTDAVAKLKDKNSVLMTVGKTSITKGQVYTMMSTASGAYTAVTDASETVAAAEVEVTDDMKSEAESTLNYYKNAYGDSFATTLAQNNMTEDDLYNNLILSSQIDALTKQYVTENFDDLVSQYTPIKAYVLDFASQDNANAALADLKNGKEPTAVVTEYSASTSTGVTQIYTTSSTLDSEVRAVITSAAPADGWSMVPGTDGKYYVVEVVENDASNMKDEVITALAGLSDMSTTAEEAYFKKYKFHIYDKPLYDAVMESYPNYIVQNQK